MGLITTVLLFKVWNIEHYLREHSWTITCFVFLLATLALTRIQITWDLGIPHVGSLLYSLLTYFTEHNQLTK